MRSPHSEVRPRQGLIEWANPRLRKSLHDTAASTDIAAPPSSAIYPRPRQHACAPATDAAHARKTGATLSKP